MALPKFIPANKRIENMRAEAAKMNRRHEAEHKKALKAYADLKKRGGAKPIAHVTKEMDSMVLKALTEDAKKALDLPDTDPMKKFYLSNPDTKAIHDKLKEEKEGSTKKDKTEHNIETGARGGRYYISDSGEKVYVP